MKQFLIPIPSSSGRDYNEREAVLNRRRFLERSADAIGAVGLAAFVLFPKLSPGSPSSRTGVVDADDFKALTKELIEKTVPNSETEQEMVEKATVSNADRDFSSTHAAFQSTFVLGGVLVPALQTQYGYWIKVHEYPRSDNRRSVRAYKDLNPQELRRIMNESEVECYGAVVHPCGEREKLAKEDEQYFKDVARNCYGVDPSSLTPLYKRPFRNPQTDKSHVAFGISSRAKPQQKDLLIDVEPIAKA